MIKSIIHNTMVHLCKKSIENNPSTNNHNPLINILIISCGMSCEKYSENSFRSLHLLIMELVLKGN
jgi:hypothetical protein